MKRISVILAAALTFFIPVQAQVKEVNTDSKINEVTVFFNGAQITRVAQVNLNPGTNILRFPRLSHHIDPNSIQIKGGSDFTIVSVTHNQNYLLDGDESAEGKAIKLEIEKVQEELDLNYSLQNVLAEEKAMIDANRAFIGQEKNITVDDMMDMSELYQSRYKIITTEALELRRKQTDLNKKMQELNQRLQVIRKNSNRYTGEILLNVSSNARKNTSITFRYFVSQASWEPGYDIKATDTEDALKLTSKAKVVQATGEDWNDVMVTLSTGNPMLNNDLPFLGQWTISGYDMSESTKKSGAKSYSRMDNNRETSSVPAKAESYNEEESLDKDMEYLEIPVTTVSNANVNTEYKIAVPYTILSDGKDYFIEIRKMDLTAAYRYYTAPEYESAAFLSAYITGWENLNLMPGNANIYFQNTYTGQSYFDTQTTLDTIELSLGRDRGIVIERKKIKDLSKEALIGSQKKITVGYEIIVKNTRSKNITLEVEDRVPVSNNKEITVEVIEISGAQHKQETGSLKWIFELKPQESKTFKILFSIKYPKDQSIQQNF